MSAISNITSSPIKNIDVFDLATCMHVQPTTLSLVVLTIRSICLIWCMEMPNLLVNMPGWYFEIAAAMMCGLRRMHTG